MKSGIPIHRLHSHEIMNEEKSTLKIVIVNISDNVESNDTYNLAVTYYVCTITTVILRCVCGAAIPTVPLQKHKIGCLHRTNLKAKQRSTLKDMFLIYIKFMCKSAT